MEPAAAPGAIYRRLGVEPIVNGRSTFTILGGSLMPPEVLEAMRQAAACFVDLTELQEAVGRRLAELTRNEAAFVSAARRRAVPVAAAAWPAGHAMGSCATRSSRRTRGSSSSTVRIASRMTP
jgi:L-seryl-tRNA(Ser) seleniumtransferase